MLRKILIVVCILCSLACSMPDTKIYSLHLNTTSSPHPAKGGLSLESNKLYDHTDKSLAIIIDSPRYLSQSYIAYRNSPYQLEISRYSKWESSPAEMVKQAFRDSLASESLFKEISAGTLPEEFYSLEINLRRFERSDEGNNSYGELVMDVNLIAPDNKNIYSNIISKKVKLEDRSFLTLAKVLSGLLSEAIGEVREDIAKYIKK